MNQNIYIVPDKDNIAESLEISRSFKANFEIQDFFDPTTLNDEAKIVELIEFYKSLPIDHKKYIIHGAFFDLAANSQDSLIRAASEQRIKQSLHIAEALGAKGVVLHSNIIANFKSKTYIKNWVDATASFHKQLLRDFACEIYLENMFDASPQALLMLMNQMGSEQQRFGICLDYGHVMTFGRNNQDDWMKLAKYIKHIHLSDNDLEDDLHLPIGSGKIAWDVFTRQLTENNVNNSSVLIEIKGSNNTKASLQYMQNHRIFPFTDIHS